MHSRLFNEVVIGLTIEPDGPILIKASDSQADPTLPSMSFVRTFHNGNDTIYLPGSSLKGVLRAHCEKLARTVQEKRLLACDPLGDLSCGKKLEAKQDDKKLEEKRGCKTPSSADVHRGSCFVCQLFGNTSLSSHFRIEDAYPDESPKTEERNGVAIDRVFGSVAVGPFNYETATTGQFKTTLHLRNVTLAHLGLLSLTLRDLEQGRVRIGFGKSRGLGVVKAQVNSFTVRYPSCELDEDGTRLRVLGRAPLLPPGSLHGVGSFAKDDPQLKDYGYSEDDWITMPPAYSYAADDWLGVVLSAPKQDGAAAADWHPLGREMVKKWKVAASG